MRRQLGREGGICMGRRGMAKRLENDSQGLGFMVGLLVLIAHGKFYNLEEEGVAALNCHTVGTWTIGSGISVARSLNVEK
jgi:hypothetical protein